MVTKLGASKNMSQILQLLSFRRDVLDVFFKKKEVPFLKRIYIPEKMDTYI